MNGMATYYHDLRESDAYVITTYTIAYTGIFLEIFLTDIIIAIPVGTATVERSFSEMKQIKTRLHNRLSVLNLPRLTNC